VQTEVSLLLVSDGVGHVMIDHRVPRGWARPSVAPRHDPQEQRRGPQLRLAHV